MPKKYTPKSAYVPKKNTDASKGIQMRKKKLLKAMEQSKGNIKVSCQKAKVDRKTYFNYYNSDEAFAEKCDEIREGIKDDILSNWIDDIMDGKDIPGRIFFAKTQMKDRGFVEKQQVEVEHTGEVIQIVPAFNPKEVEDAQILETKQIEENTEQKE